MTIPFKPFYFIRHGETEWNRQGLSMGLKDIPLNDNGLKQAEAASHKLDGLSIAHIITSPLQRALKTAQIIAKKLEIPLTVMDNFKECSWGIHEGKAIAHSDLIQKWIQGECLEGGETARDFEKRIILGLAEALQLPGPILIVSHGGVHFAMQRLLSLPFLDIKNCSPLYHSPPDQNSLTWIVRQLEKGEKS